MSFFFSGLLYLLVFLVALASVLGLLVGLVNPDAVFPRYGSENTRWKVLKLYGTLSIITILLALVPPGGSPLDQEKQSLSSSESVEQNSGAENPSSEVEGSADSGRNSGGKNQEDTSRTKIVSPQPDTTSTDSVAKRIDGNEQVLALFSLKKGSVDLTEEVTNPKARLEVLPLAFTENQAYYNAAGHEDSNSISRREKLLSYHSSFDVFVDTFSTAQFEVDSVVTTSYLCSELKAGRGHLADSSRIDSNQVGIYGEVARLSQKDRVHHLGMGIAINRDSTGGDSTKSLRRGLGRDTSLTESKYVAFRELGRHYLEVEADSVIETDIHLETITSVDFERDGTTEYLVVAKRKSDNGTHSVAFAGRFTDSGWVELFRDSRASRPSAWGNGLSLMQVVDLDRNNVPEVVFKVGGYEAFSYEIYQYEDGRLAKVFDWTPYGC